MRIFEVHGGPIPDIKAFVTPALIDEIIRNGQWTSHGSSLEDWLDTSMFASDNSEALGIDGEALEQMPYEQQRHHPDFRKCIEHWVKMAAEEFDKVLHKGCVYEKLPPFSGEMTLYRVMAVDQAWLQNTRPDFGIFWSVIPAQARRFIRQGETNVLLTTKVKNASINWYETFRSRLDYGHGNDEHEFQLNKGSVLPAVRIQVLGRELTFSRNGRA